MRPRRPARIACRAAVLTGLLAVAAPAASAASCVPGVAAARCGTVSAPLDRARPELGAIAVAYAVAPRTDKSRPSLGAVVPNPGGPSLATIARGSDYTAKLA